MKKELSKTFVDADGELMLYHSSGAYKTLFYLMPDGIYFLDFFW